MPKLPWRCDPSLFEKDLSGQVIIVTGANSGCGLETSRQLCKQGATVVLACRNVERGEIAAKDVGGTFLASLDLSSFQSVRSFVDAFKAKYERLDVLVNNAGVMACPYAKTKDGLEWQFGVNHCAHFLLQNLLAPIMIKTAEKYGNASRVVCLSSCAGAETSLSTGIPYVDFDDINWEKRKYVEMDAYSQSKLCNYLHAVGISQKYSSDKIIGASVHPGWVLSPLDGHVTEKIFGKGWLADKLASMFRSFFMWTGDMISPEDGAQTSLYCVLDDTVESGKFYSQLGIYTNKEDRAGGWPMEFPNPNATAEVADKLWKVTSEITGINE